MELPFSIKGSLTAKDSKNHSLKLLLVGFKYALVILSILAIVNIITISIQQNKPTIEIFTSLLTPLFAFIFIWIGSQMAGGITHKKKKEQLESIYYTFTDTEIITKSIGFESKTDWSTYAKATEDSKYVILYQGKYPINIIPKIYFKNTKEIQDFLVIANKKMNSKK